MLYSHYMPKMERFLLNGHCTDGRIAALLNGPLHLQWWGIILKGATDRCRWSYDHKTLPLWTALLSFPSEAIRQQPQRTRTWRLGLWMIVAGRSRPETVRIRHRPGLGPFLIRRSLTVDDDAQLHCCRAKQLLADSGERVEGQRQDTWWAPTPS